MRPSRFPPQLFSCFSSDNGRQAEGGNCVVKRIKQKKRNKIKKNKKKEKRKRKKKRKKKKKKKGKKKKQRTRYSFRWPNKFMQ